MCGCGVWLLLLMSMACSTSAQQQTSQPSRGQPLTSTDPRCSASVQGQATDRRSSPADETPSCALQTSPARDAGSPPLTPPQGHLRGRDFAARTWRTIDIIFPSVMSADSFSDTATLDTDQSHGRKLKLKKMLFKWLFAMKMFAVGLLLPMFTGLAILQSWKAVTVSLLAFGLALAVGVKSLLSGAGHSSTRTNKHHHTFSGSLHHLPYNDVGGYSNLLSSYPSSFKP